MLAWERPEGGKRFTSWKFTTLRHWGERADAGPFTLRVADFREGSGSRHPADNVDNDAGSHDGTLVSWTLKLYGHADEPEAADEQPESSAPSADERADPPAEAEADQTADAASTKSPAATLALALASAAALALAY